MTSSSRVPGGARSQAPANSITQGRAGHTDDGERRHISGFVARGSAGVAPDGGDYGLGARLALGGGLALYLAGIAFVDRVNEGARNGAVLPARLGAAALLLGLSFAGSPLSPLAFIAMVVAVLLALTAFETMRPSP